MSCDRKRKEPGRRVVTRLTSGVESQILQREEPSTELAPQDGEIISTDFRQFDDEIRGPPTFRRVVPSTPANSV